MEQLARSIDQIGNTVRRRRRLAKLSQDQLCQLTGLRQATISALEAGDRDAKLSTLFAVLSALDLELIVRDRTIGRKIEDIF
ncbi:MAG TPA: helix-turn-helix transcriptional regulator [Alphaproteobacteria bacterium]|jgi:HTH-type transcriptional regulator/antitoxin HipB|nr:helix-turn-helix transcriptional regulator [Alphaproteobacteria bacterium]